MVTLSDTDDMKTAPAKRVCSASFRPPYATDRLVCELPGGHTGDHSKCGKWWRDGAFAERDERHPEPGAPAAFNTAVKSDGYKVRTELMTSEFRLAIARVLTYGAEKYAAHNWAKGFDWSRLIGACERHLEAFKGGESYDTETGEHHLAHLGCEVMFLLEHALRGMGTDDRLKLPALAPVPADVLELRAAALAKVKADKKLREEIQARAAHNAAPDKRHTVPLIPAGTPADAMRVITASLTPEQAQSLHEAARAWRGETTIKAGDPVAPAYCRTEFSTMVCATPDSCATKGCARVTPCAPAVPPDCTCASRPAVFRIGDVDCCFMCERPVPAKAAPAFDLSDVEADGDVTVHPHPLPKYPRAETLASGTFAGYLASDVIAAAQERATTAIRFGESMRYRFHGDRLVWADNSDQGRSFLSVETLEHYGLRKPEPARTWCPAKREDGALCERQPGHSYDHRTAGRWWK